MQLPSALLSATALLVQAASGFYLSSPEPRGAYNPDPPDFAKISGNGAVVFNPGLAELADIRLDADGDVAKSGFAFINYGGDSGERLYDLVQVSIAPDAVDKITGPFIIEDGQLLYNGTRGGDKEPEWSVLSSSDGWQISLAFDYGEMIVPLIAGYHITNATLLVHES